MKRWKKWLIRAVLVAIVLPTLFAVGDRYYTRRAGESRLAEVTARLDATDHGWRLNDLLAAREARFPPDDRNVMALVQRMHPRLPKSFEAWGQSATWLPDPVTNHLPDPADVAEAARVRADCLPLIEEARKARHMTEPGGYRLAIKPNPLDTPLQPTQNLRSLVALLALDAAVSALDGKPDRAVASTHACLNAARGLGDEPFLISMLVRIASATVAKQTAERVLAWGEPRAGLAELQAAFVAEADEPLLAVALRGERAMFDRVFEQVEAGSVGLKELADDRSPPDLQAAVATWLYRGHLPGDRAAMLTTMTAYLDASRRPPHEWAASFAAVPRPSREFSHLLSGLLLPAIDKAAAADMRNKANLRSAVAAIACERFRQAKDRWPKDLAELPKDLLPAVPADPYTGEPLRFRRTDDGVVVYSVGPDTTDDGGNLSPKGDPGTDHGFRLWDPAARRAAPLPKPDPPADPDAP